MRSVEKVPVFNLTVDDVSCYYANGILTHNCDCVIMAMFRFRHGGFMRLPTDEPDETKYFKRRTGGYY